MNELTQYFDIHELTTRLLDFLPRVAAAVIVLVIFWLGYRVVRTPLVAALKKMDFHETLRELLVDKLFRYGVMLVGAVMAADQLGINIGAALAGLGVAGIAIGFAAQDLVANVIAGILIFGDKPFQVGDWIETEGQYGKVSHITLRTTRIRTPRNSYVVLPNKRIIDQTLENYSKHGALRVDVPLGIAYKENVAEARKVLLDAVGRIDGLSEEHEPDIVLTELGDSSVNLAVRVWIDNGDQNQSTFFRVLEVSKTALNDAGIEIPYPHLQLFVDDVQARVWKGLSSVPGLSVARSKLEAN